MKYAPKKRVAENTEKPWGREYLWAHGPDYAAKCIFIRKGSRLSLQIHDQKSESLLVLAGTLHLTLGKQELTLRPGESIDIPAGTEHRFAADKDHVELVEVSTPQLDDIRRLQDDYGRCP